MSENIFETVIYTNYSVTLVIAARKKKHHAEMTVAKFEFAALS